MLFNVNAYGIPRDLSYPKGHKKLTYTRHARIEAKNEKYGDLTSFLPQTLDMSKYKIVQVKTDDRGRKIQHIVGRYPLNSCFDLVLVLAPEIDTFKSEAVKVVTVWVNHVEDNHKTLNKSKFQKP